MKQKKQDDQALLIMQEGLVWAHIQQQVHNAVVQVVAQIAEFNWLEPYKMGEQFEVRGSGFIIDQAGYFITNMHVIDQASHIWIHIPALGRQTLHVEVIGVCPDIDIALLRIVPADLKKIKKALGSVPFITFGNSDTLHRTESVMSLGYPLGQHSLKSTTGVVSGREDDMGQSLIQMTAPINPGSSGGPLLTIKGEVVGVTVATVVVAHNIGYALPSNDILTVIEELFDARLVRKPFLGARFVYADDKKATLLGNPEPAGLYVGTVFADSLLDKIGVRSGDMLYEFAGFAIDAYGEAVVPWAGDKVSLQDLVSRLIVNDMSSLMIYRHGVSKRFKFKVTLEEPFAIHICYPAYEKIEYEMFGGLVIMALADNHITALAPYVPDLICYRRPENRVEPVLVITSVIPGSYMYQLGVFIPGLIIARVNDTPVHTLHDLRTAFLNSKHSLVSITTDTDTMVAFDIRQIVENEEQLSKNFLYPLCPLIKNLQKKYAKK